MKPRLFFLLLLSAMLLAGCYRQTEEPFQQVDSAAVTAEATAALVVADDGTSDDAASGESSDNETAATSGGREYITPETVPGQVEQPTVELPTSAAAEATAPAPAETLEPFVRSSPTLTFEETLDPDDECVYQVQAGNVLFRLALAWGTTYQTIMEVNQLDSEDLSIGQLLLIPDCESEELAETAEPEASVTEESAEPGPVIDDGEAESTEVATAAPAPQVEPTFTALPAIHVVSAGETIESISLKYRVDVFELIVLNEITNANQLSVGQELLLPPR